MIQWIVSANQGNQSAEQVLQAQIGSDALVEWVLVKNHGVGCAKQVYRMVFIISPGEMPDA
jgi:hypothetical protein